MGNYPSWRSRPGSNCVYHRWSISVCCPLMMMNDLQVLSNEFLFYYLLSKIMHQESLTDPPGQTVNSCIYIILEGGRIVAPTLLMSKLRLREGGVTESMNGRVGTLVCGSLGRVLSLANRAVPPPCARHGPGHSPCPLGGDRCTLNGLGVCLHQRFVRKHVLEEVALT